MTATEAKALLASTKTTPAQWLALATFLAQVGLAFLLEEKSLKGVDTATIFNRAEELFASNEASLAAHLAEYRAAE